MMQSGQGMAPSSDVNQQQQYQMQQQWMMAMQKQQQQQSTWNQQAPSQQFPPQQQQQQQQPQYQIGSQPASGDEIRTLWIGDLQYWMDENYIYACFSQCGESVSVKLIRNKQTSQLEGYGFIEFASHATAERVLQTYNGTPMPNVEQNFRLNWASFGGGEKRTDNSPDFTLFVGDLAADVTELTLQETFNTHYTSIKGAKVVTDQLTGRSKGYGFVRFGDETEQIRAMTEMNGVYCSSRPMRVGVAANKKSGGNQQYPKASYQSNNGNQEEDPNNTTIFVGGLDSNVTDEHLRQVFSQYGDVSHVKVPVGKRCAFVHFSNRGSAEEALNMLNGTLLGGQSMRLSWGRSTNRQDQSGGAAQIQTQSQSETNQFGGGGGGGGYYGYAAAPPNYGAYGYAPAAQNPNAFYGNYPTYGNGNYQQQQQQPPQQQ